ncbi:PSD1 and planctomycete cytochrome C domain-containing protein [Schlesneria sp. DSM 10557]|uniref:PSD1 and planctomycete cytochrome C domain-containing protein n=1 Tax=Schlesneria sp. DSM 10557 TaxID=3044399 RepID=UPI00359FC9A3
MKFLPQIQTTPQWHRRLCRLTSLGGLIALLGCQIVWASEPTPEQAEYFENHVRPLLIESCQQCHGSKKQEGSLRLDSRETTLKGGDSGPAIVPGKPDESLLLAAVRRSGDASAMPPDSTLKANEVAVLTKWIEMGAPWPGSVDTSTSVAQAGPLWSLQPIQVVDPPEAQESAWNQTRIDRYIHAGHLAHQVKPVGLADKRTLLRRVTYDLTGLPPTIEEIRAFLADSSPDAFATVVDRLLATPEYGERWGRHWLDVVRYADTAGDGADYPVPEAYRFRNYVIRSIANDKPFDEFVREQLAGDIIAKQALESGNQTPEQYADRVIATGFLAVGKRFGYNDNTEFVHLDIADTIDSVGRSLLGLSLGCARCHDHKYDPVSANDYYALYGIFASSRFAFPGGEELQRPRHFSPVVMPSEVQRRDEERAKQLAVLDGEIRRLDFDRLTLDPAMIGGGLDYGVEQQELGQAPKAPWVTAGPNLVLAEAQSPFTHVHPAGSRGVRVKNTVPNEGVRREFQNHTVETSPQLYFNLDFRNVDRAEGEAAYRFYLGHGAIVSLAFEASISNEEFQVRNGDAWELVSSLETGAWYNLAITFDLKHRTYSGTLLKAGETSPISFENKSLASNWDGIINTFVSDGIGKAPGRTAVRDLDNLGIQNQPFAISRTVPASPEQEAKLKSVLDSLAELKKQREQVANNSLYELAYAVSEATPVNVRVQKRGEPDRLGDEVPRRNLEILGGQPIPEGAGSGRLQLAQWFTDESNPLLARVIVNRVWQFHFGAGLVRSSSDFGVRGERPSHPELLDDLTATFVRDGWSLKSLHKLLLLSRTYQLASTDDAENLNLDAENRWLWRFPRLSLDAESIRDSMLKLSGQLDPRMPEGHPFPPTSAWNFTIHYPFKANYDSNHRSVYLMVQRSQKHPYLSLFDGADPNVSTASRFTTTTPTQALYLMNSPFVNRQASQFGLKLLGQASSDADRIRFAIESTWGVEASADDVTDFLEFLAHYREQSARLNLPEEKQNELAWGAFARVLMTSNQFLFVD